MSNRLRLLLLFFALAVMACAAVAQDTLADRARAARQNKKSTTATGQVFTNDTLGAAPKSDAPATSADNANPAIGGAQGDKEKKDDKSLADTIKDWQDKINKQKSEIAQLTRELDVAQRENRLRAATFYADAGNRLRDEKSYAEQDRKYQAEISGKQATLQKAKDTLEKMRDDARHAGVPAGQIP
jgi:hypothetical protein